MFGIAIIPSVLLALGMAISPESPRWLFQVSSQYRSVYLIKLFKHAIVDQFFLVIINIFDLNISP